MSKKFVLKDDNGDVNGNIAVPAVNFTTTAYSIVNINGSWFVAEIPIDPVTKTTGEWNLVQEDGSKMAALERFKINVAEKLI